MVTKKLTANQHRVRVTFKLPAATWADRINVVGEFNDWDTTATPMVQTKPTGDWQATIELDAGRCYRYRYLLDGKDWLNDWRADDHHHEGMPPGLCDSVVDLTCLSERLGSIRESGEFWRSE